MPGEISHEAGRAYVHILCGCLRRSVRGFKPTFDVYTAPHKLTFNALSGPSFSFDLGGLLEQQEVFVESKGYADSANLLAHFRTFLARAYCVSVQHLRHQQDQFWFVTNVPFGCKEGRQLTSEQFIREALEGDHAGPREILGTTAIDDNHVRSLGKRIAIAVFPDSFIKQMGISFKFRPGDNLWNVIKLIHGGHFPKPKFQPICAQVERTNNLPSADKIRAGQVIQLPWYGIPDACLYADPASPETRPGPVQPR